MSRYILNYIGGSKGDFLCNFINFNDTIFNEDVSNKSKSPYSHFKNLIKEDFNWDNSQKLLDSCPNIKIFPAHNANKIPPDFLIKNDISLAHLIFEKCHVKTVHIESLFKNTFVNYKDDKEYIKRWYDKCDNYEQIEYPADLLLLKVKWDINNQNRLKFLRNALINHNYYKHIFEEIELIKRTILPNDIILDYGRIFFDKDFNQLETLFNIDTSILSDAIDKTWLSNEIEIFNKTINLSSYGYRKEIH
jgi:hypothetical protein